MRFCASPSASFWRQAWKRSAVRASTASHNCCNTDLQSPTTGISMLRAEGADHVVRARAEDDDQVGLAERVVAHRQVGKGVVVGDDAAPLRGRVERDPGFLDERLHLVPGLNGAA